MRLILIAGDVFGATLGAAMAHDGAPAAAVLTSSPAARQTWSALVRGGAPLADNVGALDTLADEEHIAVFTGAARAPAWSMTSLARLCRSAVAVTPLNGLGALDGISRSILEQHDAATVELRQLPSDQPKQLTISRGEQATYQRVVRDTAQVLLARLSTSYPAAEDTAAPWTTALEEEDSAAPPPPFAGYQVDWTRHSRQVLAQILAAPPTTPAWTWWGGLRLSVSQAQAASALRRFNVPAGTVVGTDAGCPVIACGTGSVVVRAAADLIGPVDLSSVAAGDQFGLNVVDAVDTLQQRVTDLEAVARYLASQLTIQQGSSAAADSPGKRTPS